MEYGKKQSVFCSVLFCGVLIVGIVIGSIFLPTNHKRIRSQRLLRAPHSIGRGRKYWRCGRWKEYNIFYSIDFVVEE